MNEENLREIQQIVEQANAGNWIPFALIGSVMLLVITLLVYIWNDKLKTNEQQHSTHSQMLNKLTETSVKTEVILERLCVKSEVHEDEIKTIKRELTRK